MYLFSGTMPVDKHHLRIKRARSYAKANFHLLSQNNVHWNLNKQRCSAGREGVFTYRWPLGCGILIVCCCLLLSPAGFTYVGPKDDLITFTCFFKRLHFVFAKKKII